MKVRELLDILDETIAEVKIAIVSNQQRALESPYTSYEFTQRAIELQEDLDDLLKVREFLAGLDPEDDVENHFPREELEKFLKLLELLRKADAHAY
ncbi:hypothetical protein TEU_04845 [Thermococcus eurythermalis]|uniref:Uncharacterized protein n=1 Tax=Thermococcus eurythermalis TaxID=1505907 RepID=A0A097QTA9_9EURY|nr:hypothetical protein [Thermococcus eurythermalis]AIU69715.1 hypothetical protein TEU_04845 [Thermococcus eurythermalis]